MPEDLSVEHSRNTSNSGCASLSSHLCYDVRAGRSSRVIGPFQIEVCAAKPRRQRLARAFGGRSSTGRALPPHQLARRGPEGRGLPGCGFESRRLHSLPPGVADHRAPCYLFWFGPEPLGYHLCIEPSPSAQLARLHGGASASPATCSASVEPEG